jgi:hypothetical protein
VSEARWACGVAYESSSSRRRRMNDVTIRVIVVCSMIAAIFIALIIAIAYILTHKRDR